MAKLSPMMEQYLNSKEQYPDCILMYRLGDFYEMFFDDAVTAARELEITLTGKDCGMEERAPMCGVPHHALDTYLNKLVSKGYKVAIGEQMEDPKNAKGIVRREVTRVVTAGTNFNTDALDETKNNYLMSVIYLDGLFGISAVDITTADYYVTEVNSIRNLTDELSKFMPSEIICNQAFYVSGFNIEDLSVRLNIVVSPLDSWYFDDELCRRSLMEQFEVMDLAGLGLGEYPLGVIAAGSLLQYLKNTQKTALLNLTKITPYSTEKFMVLDTSTRRNLELTETLREKHKKGSLLGVLDRTKTAMGARMLRGFLTQPLIDKKEIFARQNAIEDFNKHLIERDEIREYLQPIYDLERIMAKITYHSANPRDLISFKKSLEMIPFIHQLLKTFKNHLMSEIFKNMDTLEDISSLIDSAVREDSPISIKEGGIIREGFNDEIDRLRSAKTEGKKWLAELETREKERTGIKSLKVKYNKVFGYCIEITNSYKDIVPEDYTRKQTLVNAERYITLELKELEETILGAQDKLFALEYELFSMIRDNVASEVLRIQSTAKFLAEIDVFTSLAYVAERNNYTRPSINEKGMIDIQDGRHPVVEKMIPNDLFVSNDTELDNYKKRISIITGPNMAGKSTYMRQVALIVLMAQIGSFVPAASADIGICDRIFTRVGASDDLASGQSTFMVEMTEVANILRNATQKSLLILDEIGRGTSTFDGLSIAWAVIEYIANPKILGAKTLFATHYHELTELEGMLESVNNYCIAVKEKGDDIIFLRKIVKGGADQSYGIQVAKLAGVPDLVIQRAKEIATELVSADIAANAASMKKPIAFHSTENEQISLFDVVKNDDIIDELKEIDLANLTPIDALNILYKLQNRINNRWKS